MSDRSSARIEEEGDALRLDLPAAHSAGRMARQVVRRFAEVRGIVDRELSNLELITSELLGNAVDHGGGNSAMEEDQVPPRVRMYLDLQLESRSWRLSVSDQGGAKPEDLQYLLDPPGGIPDLEDERGRGFFLLLDMVDSLEVEASADGKGVAFIAKRTLPEPAPEEREADGRAADGHGADGQEADSPEQD
ncbi:MAG: ATP-binding protein [Planctomycetota bacterium]